MAVVAKVLLVDDYETQLNCWARDCRVLEKVPLRARTRSEALEVAKVESPQLAIVDLFLQQEYGVDVVRDLKAHDANIHVVLVSAMMTVDYAMLGVRAGADDCYCKFVRCRQIITAVEQELHPPPLEEYPAPDQIEWEYILHVLMEHDGNLSRTAAALNLHRQALQQRIKKRGGVLPASVRRGKPAR